VNTSYRINQWSGFFDSVVYYHILHAIYT